MRAADGIVSSLKAHGISRVYCVPGESYLVLLDALRDSGIEIIICRHEGGAGFMAAAEAKLTGKPGVCLVSRGPGATNASIAVHFAEQDAVPLILMVGQVSRDERTRGVFQEMDYAQFFGGLAKGVFEINDGKRVQDIMPRAMRLATEGTPGAVILSLPEDMLGDPISEFVPSVFPPARQSHSSKDVAHILDLISRCERPIVIAGSCLRGAQGAEALRRFAEALRIPVATSWKNQDVFDNTSDLYAGHTGFGASAAYKAELFHADLIFAVGTRLGDIASLQFSFPQSPEPQQTLIHVYPDGKPLGRSFNTDFALIADPAALLLDLAQHARVASSLREAWVARINGFVKRTREFTSSNPSDGVDFGAVIVSLAKHAPADCIITTDSGNAPTWVHRHWPMTPKNTLLGAIAGSMGFGVPAATVASLVHPKRMAICIVGDGGILMTGNELATARAFGATPKVVISDNGTYGTIRLHQERDFPKRISGTDLANPDFTAWAKSFGLDTVTLQLGDDVDEKVQEFLASSNAAVLHVKSSQRALSAMVTMAG
jgi:acetolactate synthase I/II/III large subunit